MKTGGVVQMTWKSKNKKGCWLRQQCQELTVVSKEKQLFSGNT